MEYYRATTALTRLQQQQPSLAVSSNLGGGAAPMDIGATYNKGKGKSKGKGKGKYNNGKGYKGKGKGYGAYNMHNKGKGKGQKPYWPAIPKGTEKGNKGKSKGATKGKGKHPTQGCYRCGQQGHLARDCRVSVYNMSDARQDYQTQDPTAQWYSNSNAYDDHWWNQDQAAHYNNATYQLTSSQLALTSARDNTNNTRCLSSGPHGSDR